MATVEAECLCVRINEQQGRLPEVIWLGRIITCSPHDSRWINTVGEYRMSSNTIIVEQQGIGLKIFADASQLTYIDLSQPPFRLFGYS